MDAMRHAFLARQLIGACGGLEAAASACRLKKTRLQLFTDPNAGSFMPMDVVADLEAYCGRASYSQAVAAERPQAPDLVGALADEACSTVEAAAELQELVRRHKGGDALTMYERRKVDGLLVLIEEHVRRAQISAEAVRA